jgi:DNA polymerase III subunit gamma/tau
VPQGNLAGVNCISGTCYYKSKSGARFYNYLLFSQVKMSYISFYRKWRPQTFSEIIGQEHVVQTLENAISKNRISHAYIFCGPRGTGKTSLARILAKALNCINGPTSKPCNKCDNCTSISAGTSVDVIEIDAASHRGIDEIRDLREKAKYLPANLSKKVYIIDEVHMLTPEAFNALLKVLEEPPAHVIFILATTEPNKVLATIMSRCQRFDFFPISMDKIKKRLKDISSIENITINESAINLIAKYADGSLRDADGILEQLSSLGEDNIKVEDITSLLGVIDLEMLFELANILIEKNLNQALFFAHRVIYSNLNLKIFVSEFIDHLYSLYVIKKYDNPLEILDIGEDFKERYFSQSKQFSPEEIEFLTDLFSDLLKQIKWGESAKTFFKSAIIKAINYNFIEDDRLDLKFKKISKDVELLKNELSKINKISSLKSENKVNSTSENIENVNVETETPHEVPTDTAALKDIKYDNERIVYDNWKNLCTRLKEKNISIQAMFAETKNFKIEDDTIYFYLEENKKWHKEQLSKRNNIKLIQDIIKEIIGKSYQIIFDTLKPKDNKDTKVIDLSISLNEDNSSTKIKNNTSVGSEIIVGSKNTEKVDSNVVIDDGEDIYDYIEKKFEIKENQKEN